MAKSETVSSETPSKTAKVEFSKKYSDEYLRQRFADSKDAFKRLRDFTKNSSRNVGVFDKEVLRSYFQNIVSNEGRLRNLSWYLFYRSQVYARLVQYYANMFVLYARSVIPNHDLTKETNSSKVLKSFQDTVDELDKMRLQQEFYPILLTNFIQDVSYNVWVEDDDGVFVLPWPADYARISGKYMTGEFAYAIDCTYLRNHRELMEYFPEPFEQLYRDFETTNEKWQPMPEEFSLCTKYRSEDIETSLGPLMPMANSIVNLLDLEDIQAVAAEQEIYKLIWYELETLDGTDTPDDWRVDVDLAVDYFNKMVEEAIPPNMSAAIVPGKLNEISFPDNAASDTTKVAKATETVLNTAGGAEVLNGSTINNTYAFRLSTRVSTEYAISSLLPQIQSWVNHRLQLTVSDPCKVKFFPESVYTLPDYKEQLLTAAQNGFPTILAYGACNGYSEKDTIALNNLEANILGLTERFIPLSTSYTQSSEGGRPKTPDDELSESGDRTRNTAE